MDYTLSVFSHESNLKDEVKRETIIDKLKLGGKPDAKKPILMNILAG